MMILTSPAPKLSGKAQFILLVVAEFNPPSLRLADVLPPNVRVRWIVETTLSGNQVVPSERIQWRQHVDGQQQQIDGTDDVVLQPLSFRTFVITCEM